MNKTKSLEQMRYEIYKSISNADKVFDSFTPDEKLVFAQKAFIDTNFYVCRMYGLDPNKTAFGFCIGRPVRAVSNKDNRSVACDINFALNARPIDVYKTMFHENKHIQQQVQNTKVGRLGNDYRPILKAHPQSKLVWQFAPQERDADNYAYSTLTQVMYQGLIQSKDKAQPTADYMNSLKNQVKNYNHIIPILKTIFNSPISTIQDFFAKTNEPTRMRYFTLKETSEIIFQNLEVFTEGNYSQQKKACEDFALFDNRPHLGTRFFREYRTENWDLSKAQEECFDMEKKLGLINEKNSLDEWIQQDKNLSIKELYKIIMEENLQQSGDEKFTNSNTNDNNETESIENDFDILKTQVVVSNNISDTTLQQ